MTPARVARLGLRRGDSGGGWSVLVVLIAFGVLGGLEDLDGRIGSTKLMSIVSLVIFRVHVVYGGAKQRVADRCS